MNLTRISGTTICKPRACLLLTEQIMKKTGLLTITLLILATTAMAQRAKFGGEWEQWWDRKASKGIVVELQEKNGRVWGTASGAIPRLYEAEIKPARITGNSFVARIEDDWGNNATVKFTIRGGRLTWRVTKSDIKASMTFPLTADLRRRRRAT
jgi:hypothetical protein